MRTQMLAFALFAVLPHGGVALTLHPAALTNTSTASSCHIEALSTATASASYPGGYGPEKMIDGDALTSWNSGGAAPAWIQLTWPSPRTITKVRAKQGAYDRVVVVTGDTGVALFTWTTTYGVKWLDEHVLASPVTTTTLRLTMTSGEGWISWLEIEVFENCAVGATGDPHMINVKGQRFDLLERGDQTLIHIPRGATPADTLLRVDAFVTGGRSCNYSYIRALNITGKWLPANKPLGIQHDALPWGEGGSRILRRPRHHVGPLILKVGYGKTKSGYTYLNFHAGGFENLENTNMTVGGLLGTDDPTNAQSKERCLQQARFSNMSYIDDDELPPAGDWETTVTVE